MKSKLAACIIAGFLCLPAFAVENVRLLSESHQLTELRWDGASGRSYQWQVVTEVDGVLSPWPGYSGRSTTTGVTLTPPLTLEGVWYGRVRDVTVARGTWVMSPPVLVHGIDLHASPRSGLIPTDDTGYANLGRLPDRVTDSDIVWSVKPRSAATLTREGIGNRVEITPHAKVGKKFTVTATIDVDASLDAALSKRFKVGEANLAVEIAGVPDRVEIGGALEPTGQISGSASGPIDYAWSVNAGYFLGKPVGARQRTDDPAPTWMFDDLTLLGRDKTITLTVTRGGYVRTASTSTEVFDPNLQVEINFPDTVRRGSTHEAIVTVTGRATGEIEYEWEDLNATFVPGGEDRSTDPSPLVTATNLPSAVASVLYLTVTRGGFSASDSHVYFLSD